MPALLKEALERGVVAELSEHQGKELHAQIPADYQPELSEYQGKEKQ